MTDIEPGQVWEVYSSRERRWEPAFVIKIEGEQVTLRYEGFLEFFTADLSIMQSKPELFRPAPPNPG
jgi:hypothetical protein